MRSLIPVLGCLATLMVSQSTLAQETPVPVDETFLYESEPRPTPLIQQVSDPSVAPVPAPIPATEFIPAGDPELVNPGIPRDFSKGELSHPGDLPMETKVGSPVVEPSNVTTLTGSPRNQSPVPLEIASPRNAAPKRLLIIRESQRANARIYRIQQRKAHSYSPLRPNIRSGHHAIDLNSAGNTVWNGMRVRY